MKQYSDALYEKAIRYAQQGDTRYQCLLHLIDLKRAGHSPTRTEYKIPPQYGKRVTPAPEIRTSGWQ